MKISAKVEYACIAMAELAAARPKSVNIKSISEKHGLPPRFLVQILLQMKGAGLIASIRGAKGGYKLIGDPRRITLGQIAEAMDGKETAEFEPNSTGDSAVIDEISQVMEKAEEQRQKVLAVSLSTIVKRSKA